MTASRPDHRALAEALRYRVLEGRGASDHATRKAAADRAGGGPAMAAPYDDLASQIGECSHRVTAAQAGGDEHGAGSEVVSFEHNAASTSRGALRTRRRGRQCF